MDGEYLVISLHSLPILEAQREKNLRLIELPDFGIHIHSYIDSQFVPSGIARENGVPDTMPSGRYILISRHLSH